MKNVTVELSCFRHVDVLDATYRQMKRVMLTVISVSFTQNIALFMFLFLCKLYKKKKLLLVRNSHDSRIIEENKSKPEEESGQRRDEGNRSKLDAEINDYNELNQQ